MPYIVNKSSISHHLAVQSVTLRPLTSDLTTTITVPD